MKPRTLIGFAGALILWIMPIWTGSAEQDKPHSIPTNDLIKLSEAWWGASIEEFPKLAGLRAGEYSQENHPSRLGVNIIVVSAKTRDRWLPKELPPLQFDFTGANGLQEISGFYKGTQEDVRVALTKRYGTHKREARAIGMVVYDWEFDKTILDLTAVYFSLYPKNRLAK